MKKKQDEEVMSDGLNQFRRGANGGLLHER
jgi:hypothetical protein